MARDLHPANSLNELTGEEWLYFTKSLWSTAYPSELGHARRKAHGANKPPRLMARLIEFFTRSGELVLDPFAGVGGTLLGAALVALAPLSAPAGAAEPFKITNIHFETNSSACDMGIQINSKLETKRKKTYARYTLA